MSSSLADLVARRRIALGHTTRGLAARIGVSSAYIAHIEHGRIDTPSPPVLAALARELRLPEEVLLRAMGYLQAADSSTERIDLHSRSLRELIRRAREARAMTQPQLDEAIGVSVGYVSMIESGQIECSDSKITCKLQAVLGISDEELQVTHDDIQLAEDDARAALERIASLRNREQRLEAWAALPEGLRTALLVLMQDVLLAGAHQLWQADDQVEKEYAVG